MTEICPTCGLPQELCVCEDIAKEDQTIDITIERKKFGKESTIISGLDPKTISLKDVGKELKGKFACGGTVKGNRIELQGNHLNRIKDELVALGFDPALIHIEAYTRKGRK